MKAMCNDYKISFYTPNLSRSKVSKIADRMRRLGVPVELLNNTIHVNGASLDDVELVLDNALATIDQTIRADIVDTEIE